MIAYLIILILFLIFAGLRWDRSFKPFDTKTTLPIRGILALAIIFHHTSQTYGNEEGYWSPFYHFLTMGAPIVAIFFFLSGYGLCISLSKKGKSYINGFIPKRLSTFLPEMVLLSICSIAIFYLLLDQDLLMQLNKFITGFPPLPSSWFLYALIFVYIAFYISAKICHADPLKTGYCLTLFIFFMLDCIVL